jgi:hypothetical protein
MTPNHGIAGYAMKPDPNGTRPNSNASEPRSFASIGASSW